MSTQMVNDFRNLINSNPAVAAACREAVAAGGGQAVAELGRKHGFDFSEADVVAVLEDAELSDLELELVAGGVPASGQSCGGGGGGEP